MKEKTTGTIDTTQGEIKIRPLFHKEAKEIFKLAKGKAEDAEERIEAIMAECVIEGREKLDELEEHEVASVYDAIRTLGTETARKN